MNLLLDDKFALIICFSKMRERQRERKKEVWKEEKTFPSIKKGED